MDGQGYNNYVLLQEAGGSVGIGTSSPQEMLEVNGNIRLTNTGRLEAGSHPYQLTLATNGSVGINKASPDPLYKLDVG